MKISIVIPALNEEKLIKGILEQLSGEIRSKYDIEVIVSDGGSNDKTPDIAKAYADKTISDSSSIQNISHGRNSGASYSMGNVLVFLNADVLIDDADYFFSQVKAFGDNENVCAIACKIKIFPPEEKFGDRIFHMLYNNYVAVLNKFFMGMGRGECHIIRRDKFFEAGGYDERIIAGEDFDLYRRLRRKGKVVYRGDLVVYESPRRYRKYGYARIFWEWMKNSISVMIFGKSVSKSWETVR